MSDDAARVVAGLLERLAQLAERAAIERLAKQRPVDRLPQMRR